MSKTLLFALLALCALPPASGQVSPERIAELERQLEEQRARNELQGVRLKQLEQTLASVIAAQAESEAAMETSRLESLVEEVLQHKLPSMSAPETGRSMFDVSGAARISFRSFGGTTVSTDESVELEHVFLRMTVTPDDRFTLQLTPAASHEGHVFVVEAFGTYEIAEALDITVGRFIAPFNGFHAWAFPSDSFIDPYAGPNAPKPFLYAPWWDEGLMLSGDLAFGDDDQHRFDYAGWVVNGMNPAGLAGVHKTSFGDNNENKTFGGRVSAALRLSDDAVLTVGFGAMGGKTDALDELDFWAITADADLRWGAFGLYVEYMHRPSEIRGTVIENPTVTLVQSSALSSVKLKISYRFLPELELFGYADQLWVRQPPRTGSQFSVFDLDKESFKIGTYVIGAKYDLTANVRLIFELGFFDKDPDLGKDIPFASVSALFYF